MKKEVIEWMGDYVILENEEEAEEVVTYLKLLKKYTLRKYNGKEEGEAQLIDKPSLCEEVLIKPRTIGIKFAMKRFVDVPLTLDQLKEKLEDLAQNQEYKEPKKTAIMLFLDYINDQDVTDFYFDIDEDKR